MTPEERAEKIIRDWDYSGDLHPLIAAAVREAEADIKERAAKVAEGELSATDRVVQSEIAHRIRALE